MPKKPKMYADLHCHPSMYAYNRMRNQPHLEQDPEQFHLWRPLPENHQDMAAGVRGATYAQADFPKQAKAGGRLIFASITPIEKEFFGYDSDDTRHRSFWWELFSWISLVTPVTTLWHWLRGRPYEALGVLTRILRNHSGLRTFIQCKVLGYSKERVQYLQSKRFDYWDEYLKEYQFFKNKDGERTKAPLMYAKEDGRIHAEEVEGCYHIIQNKEQFEELLGDESRDEIAVVMTIEGAHVVAIGPDLKRVPDELLMQRIDYLKKQEHPLFFITFAHHFNNGLCGHAHSIPGHLSSFTDQTHRMNEGFAEENDNIGMRAARTFLHIDEELEPLQESGRRVLLDIKHMSATTRKQYYERITKPYREKWQHWPAEKQAAHPVIPLIASHACYAGVRTLDELAQKATQEDDHWHAPPFNAWNINLCDEDMVELFESGGLVGICFEQRIAGVGPHQRVPREKYAYLVLQHILALVDAVYQDESRPIEERRKVWDCICLGTDYDGMIDPLTAYPTVLSLDEWAEDLRDHLTSISHTRQIAEIGVDELVEKIAWRNAYEFAQRHWPMYHHPEKDEAKRDA